MNGDKTLAEIFSELLAAAPRTLNEFLEESVEKYRDLPASGAAFGAPMTYGVFFDRVEKVAGMLVEKGIHRGDRVAILGENSSHWGISYFAVQRVGAAAVPILPDFPEADIRHILCDSEVKIMFTTRKMLERVGDLGQTRLKHIITLDDFETELQDIKVEPISEIIEKAVDFIKKIPGAIGLKSKEIAADDIASIIYTSGTSGHSKAVMLSHRNLIANTLALSILIDLAPGSTFLSILPLSHVYEFTVGFLFPLRIGARVVYPGVAPTPANLEKVCRQEHPHCICAVPLILEKIYKKRVMPVLEKNKLVKLLAKVPGLKQKIHKKIRDKLMDFFGGELVVMAIGGAPFNLEAEKFFRGCGFPYLVGYGLTETSPLLAGGPWGDKSVKLGSTGKVTPGSKIRIVDADEKSGVGEIYGWGPNVMRGYFKNPKLTAEVLDKEGWFKTGDLGRFDKLGNLYITGRSKNMILMANGENIFPEAVEEVINASIYVVESLVTEREGRLEAWVYPDYDLIDAETRGKTETQRARYIEQILEKVRASANEQLSAFSKLARVVEQTEPFEKTPTHKIKRYLYTHQPQK